MVKIEKTIKSSNSALLFAEIMNLEQAAWDSNFYIRQPNKITATALFASFFETHQSGKNTLKNWSANMSLLIGKSVSEQSIDGRMNERAVTLAKEVLKEILDVKTPKNLIENKKNIFADFLHFFNRVLIRDSTTQKLPSHLHEDFPGSHSHGKPTAIARVQSLFNFTDAKWLSFEVSAYTDNDQKAAACIEEDLQVGDLILQDLGYFSLNWFEQVIESQYIVSYWKSGTNLYYESGEKIDLLQLLKGKRVIDMPVLVGAKKQLSMRLVVKKLSKSKADKKIKEAKKNRHSKSNHSAEYYNLLRYEIYLTNVSRSMLNAKNIAKIYGLRWYIETLFKSWKSYANFKCLFEKGKMKLQRTLFTIYAVLIEFVYLQNYVLDYFQNNIKFGDTEFISSHRYMDVVNDIFNALIKVKTYEDLMYFADLIKAKATYRKHSKRKNTMEKYLYVNELCIIKK
jgi:hypothetical protein